MSLSLPSLSHIGRRLMPIIGSLVMVFVLSGCSAVRLGYNSGPTLAYWWLDSYFDFDSTQAPRIRDDLQAVQDWHRQEELPLLIQLLKDLQAMAPKQVTGEQVCHVVDSLQTRLEVTLDRVSPSIAAIAPTLKPKQLEHVSEEFERRNRKWREQWLDGTVAERADRRVQQIVDRAEYFYGTLEPVQLGIVKAHIEASTFDGPRQYKEMERRHQDAMQVLKDIRTTKMTPAQATAAIHGLLERSLKAPDPQYRQYMEHLTSESCAAMAALHNASTPEQKIRLARALQDYEEDAKALATQTSIGKPRAKSL